MRGHCVFVLAKFQVCNILSIFSLCLWRLILHLLELGFESKLDPNRRAIASVTIHSKGVHIGSVPYRISLSFIWQNTIFLYTLFISIIISGNIASYFLEILMIRYL